jgi:acylphosphatase
MAVLALRLIIIGRVQGVGFRAWTCRQARRRSLRGWVRNRSDGSVEALIIGDGAAVEAMIDACASGPALAEVRELRRDPAEDDGSAGFHERPTI